MSDIEIPRFLEFAEDVWVRVKDHRQMSSTETVCIVEGVLRERVIIVPSSAFSPDRGVMARKVGTVGDGDDHWLIDLPLGERLLVSKELVAHGDLV
ncbi:MAG: hypothetical protein F4Z77_01625 [Dehalococcoidia bacterium]|nr:hypothetical protein [Dehalococcoidia bacterium]MYA52610.1 hypothetical protein [Dehalococcoidia bacterium]